MVSRDRRRESHPSKTDRTKAAPRNFRDPPSLVQSAGGTAMGFIGLAIWPGQWKVVLRRKGRGGGWANKAPDPLPM
jgi:hypothetical protein